MEIKAFALEDEGAEAILRELKNVSSEWHLCGAQRIDGARTHLGLRHCAHGLQRHGGWFFCCGGDVAAGSSHCRWLCLRKAGWLGGERDYET